MTKIKICGIQDPETAFLAAQAGADFIGIMQIPTSKRYVPLSLAIEIAAAAKKGGAEPVAVYADASKEDVLKGCTAMGVRVVQHYGAALQLPEEYRFLYINRAPVHFRAEKDYLLFDTSEGRGVVPDLKSIQPPEGMPWFLAGGLTPDNVREVLLLLKPQGVDVSSGVEKEGKKDKQLIKLFIQEVRR